MDWKKCERRLWEIISNTIDVYDNPAWESILDTELVDDLLLFIDEEVEELG